MPGDILNGVNNFEVVESWSSTKINCIKLRQTWTIKNFGAFSSKTYEKLMSPVFSTDIKNSDTAEWRLWMFPNGDIKGSTDYVGLYLQLVTCAMEEIQTKYRLGIVNANGEDINYLHSSNLMKTGSLGGHARFVQRKVLFNRENYLLPKDELTVYCEITAAVGIENVTLSVGEICCKSDEAKFQDSVMKESSNIGIQMTHADERYLYEMLSYVYTGKIGKLKKMPSRLLSLIDKCEVSDLKIRCEKMLIAGLSLTNVAKFFQLSDKIGATELKTQIKKFIAANASALADTHEFKSMFLAYPYLGVEAFRALNDKSDAS